MTSAYGQEILNFSLVAMASDNLPVFSAVAGVILIGPAFPFEQQNGCSLGMFWGKLIKRTPS